MSRFSYLFTADRLKYYFTSRLFVLDALALAMVFVFFCGVPLANLLAGMYLGAYSVALYQFYKNGGNEIPDCNLW